MTLPSIPALRDTALSKAFSVALKAATKAGKLIKREYGKIHEIGQKGVGDLVSRVDHEADHIIQTIIRQEYTNDDILSEELTAHTKDRGQRLWVIDPLDGTAGFLFQTGPRTPSVMIALREHSETKLSVIFFPLTREYFYAIHGKGCFKDGKKVSTKDITHILKEAWIDMNHNGNSALESRDFARLDRALRSEKGAGLVTRSAPHSGIITRMLEKDTKLAAVIHDNNRHKVKQGPWDIIPAQLILEEAGGVMVNIKNQKIDPFKPELIVAAANRSIADSVIKLLEPV